MFYATYISTSEDRMTYSQLPVDRVKLSSVPHIGDGAREEIYLFFGRFIAVILITVSACLHANAQTAFLYGQIKDKETLQPINGGNILLVETGVHKTADTAGTFSFENIHPGTYTLSIHHIAYSNIDRRFTITANQADTLIFFLQPSIFHYNEVIVRSTRTPSVNTSTPYSSDVVMDDQLLESIKPTVPDELGKIPGISLVRDGIWQTEISIRGLSRSSIVTLVDDTRIETATDIAGPLSLINIHDLDRVETIKSSGSVLYGTGSIGGIVDMITKRAPFSDNIQTSAELSNDFSSVNGCSSQYAMIERSSEQLALRVSGGYQKAENTMTPAGEIPNSQYRDFTICSSLGVKTFSDETLVLSYQRAQADDTGIPGGAPFPQSATATYTLARRELFGVDYTVPNISETIPLLTVHGSRQDIDRNVELIQSPTIIITPEATHITTDVDVESKIIPFHDDLLTIGADVWQRAINSRREKHFLSKNQIIGDLPIPNSSYFSAGIYTQHEGTILGNATLVMGARYDWIRVHNDEVLNPQYIITSGVIQNSPPNQQVLWNAANVHNESWSANAGLTYPVNSYCDITMLAATAFRSPTPEERYEFLDLGSIVYVGNPNLQPERSLAYNAGLRFHTGTMRIQADGFYNHLTNLVSQLPGTFDGRSAYISENIGEARLYGGEITDEVTPVTWIAIKMSASYVRGEDILNHRNLPQIAPFSGQFDVTGNLQKFGTLTLSCWGSAAQNNLATGETETAGYVIMDMNVGVVPVNLGQLSLMIRSGVQNIFNREYQSHLSTLRGLIQYEPGRNVFLSVTMGI